MAIAKPASKAKERRHLLAVLGPLVHSMRGQIFLANLDDALRFLDAPSLLAAFHSVRATDARRMHEADYLGHVRAVLQRATPGQLLRNPVSSFDEFASDGWIVNVLPYASYKVFYEDASAALSGHIAFNSLVGTRATAYKVGSSTASYWWMAARASFPHVTMAREEARTCRDMLGLVHFDDRTPLVAMHVEFRSFSVFRPTVVEANPNARFRQIDPTNPSETRWGRTVDLEKLGNLSAGADIGGVPELVAAKFLLADATQVHFYYLGTAGIDRSTSSMDATFLNMLLNGRKAEEIGEHIIEELLA